MMLGNYAVTAVRSLRANKLYAAITILGLSVGLAACILLFLFVRHELSYDRSWLLFWLSPWWSSPSPNTRP